MANWYIILELDFDPPVTDEAAIAKRIEEKGKFWAEQSNHFMKGPKYRALLESIPQIKKDMLGPANRRAEIAKEACEEIYSGIDKLLKMLSAKGHITSKECEGVAKECKTDVSLVEKRAKFLKITIKSVASASGVRHPEYYDKYYNKKPEGADDFSQADGRLSSFDVTDMYGFLYRGTDVKNPQSFPYTTLLQRAEELNKTFLGHSAADGSGKHLCSMCKTTFFKDDATKAMYDRYLEHKKLVEVLRDVKKMASIAGNELNPETADQFIGLLTQVLKNREIAVDLLAAFCAAEKINLRQNEETRQIKVCRCGRINDVSDGHKICSGCGLSLVIKCPNPKCGAENENNANICTKCGFRFENIDRARSFCSLAEHCIETLEFDLAQAHLSDAERFWPGCPDAQPIKARLTEYKGRVGAEVDKMRKAIAEKRYIEAQALYNNIRKLFPGYSDEETAKTISNAVSKAQALFAKAKASKIDTEILNLCAEAYDVCADLPGVRELMPPPPVVTGVNISVNENSRTNNISWTSNNDRSVRFILVRSENGWVQNITDGETVFKGSAASYADTNIKAGVTYYYNVFAERAGIFSQGSKSNIPAVTNFFEIRNVSVAAADGSLNIVWDRPPENATVELYESGPLGEKLLASTNADSYLISGLNNGQSYRYHVLFSYVHGGQKKQTKGTVVTGVPDRPANPIDTLRVKPVEGDNYDAIWFTDEPYEVRLYCSTKRPKYEIGDIVSLTALELEMKPIQQKPISNQSKMTLGPSEKGVSFQYSGTELLYITAVVIKNGSAVFGSLCRASKDSAVKINNVRPLNGRLSISIEAPKDASGYVILTRTDRFSTEVGDTQAKRKFITRKQYLQDNLLILDALVQGKYYISVYAQFRRDGDTDYSPAADFFFDNSPKADIEYSIKVKKGFSSCVEIEFSSTFEEFDLPSIDIMANAGFAPAFKNQGAVIETVPEQHVKGSLKVKIPLKRFGKNSYVKAFFTDDSATAGSMLKVKVGSDFKVS